MLYTVLLSNQLINQSIQLSPIMITEFKYSSIFFIALALYSANQAQFKNTPYVHVHMENTHVLHMKF